MKWKANHLTPRLQESRQLVSLCPRLCGLGRCSGGHKSTSCTLLWGAPLLSPPSTPCSWATGLTSLLPVLSHIPNFGSSLSTGWWRSGPLLPPPLLVQFCLVPETFSRLLPPSPYSPVTSAVQQLPLLLLLHRRRALSSHTSLPLQLRQPHQRRQGPGTQPPHAVTLNNFKTITHHPSMLFSSLECITQKSSTMTSPSGLSLPSPIISPIHSEFLVASVIHSWYTPSIPPDSCFFRAFDQENLHTELKLQFPLSSLPRLKREQITAGEMPMLCK